MSRFPAVARFDANSWATYLLPQPRWRVGSVASTRETFGKHADSTLRLLRPTLQGFWSSRRLHRALQVVRVLAHDRLHWHHGLHGDRVVLLVSFGPSLAPAARWAQGTTPFRAFCRDSTPDSSLRPDWRRRQPVDPKKCPSRRPGEKHRYSFSRRARSSSSCGTGCSCPSFVKDGRPWTPWSSLNVLFQRCRCGAAV